MAITLFERSYAAHRCPIIICFCGVAPQLKFHASQLTDNREEGQGLKNHTSTLRRFPLHSAIKDEIADYIRSLPANSPLFPDVKADRDGKRSHNAG
jgi:hypothetical protein